MARTISGLVPADALDGTELIETVQAGNSRRTTTQDIADLAPGGGGGLSLESYQNSAMSAAVMAYVYRDVDDNIYRVYEPIRNNDVSRSQFAYADSIDLFPFDSVVCFNNACKDLKLIDIASDVIIQGCTLETMIIDGNSHTSLKLINHSQKGKYGLDLYDSPLPNGAEIYVTGNNVYFYTNFVFGSGNCFDSIGANTEIFGITVMNDSNVIYFNSHSGCVLASGTMWEDGTNIYFYNNTTYLSDFSIGGFCNIHVPTGSLNGNIYIEDFCTLGDATHRYLNYKFVRMGANSTLKPSDNGVATLSKVVLGMDCTITSTGDKTNWNVNNINGTEYELAVTLGAVTATPV